MHFLRFEYTSFKPHSYIFEHTHVTLADALIVQTIIDSLLKESFLVKVERVIGGGPATSTDIRVIAFAIATLSAVATEGSVQLSALGAHDGLMLACLYIEGFDVRGRGSSLDSLTREMFERRPAWMNRA